jgi:NAD(P)-dependent dehydrogenase (short-subunit alcohol dehydrogenase family)
MRDFKGKVVFITGAAGGLGRAMSRRFGQAGARLGLTDLDEAEVEVLARELREEGIECLAQGLDVTEEGACAQAVAAVVESFGGLDVLINNAGIAQRSALVLTQAAVYRRVMDVNFFGSLYCTQAALSHLIARQGLIIVISSVAGFSPLLGRTGYAASKHALHGLFDSLRAELRESGVGVTIVCPSFVATGIEKNALGGDGRPTGHPQSRVGKVATPESVADAVFEAAVRGKRLLVLSFIGRLTRLMTKLCRALFERMMARSLASELKDRS